MRIFLDNPSGLRPIMSKDKLSPNEASIADNVNLVKGDIRPFRGLKRISQIDYTDSAKTLHKYYYNDIYQWFTYDKFASFVKSPISGDQYERIYFKIDGDGSYPGSMYYANDLDVSSFPSNSIMLGFNEITTAPTVTPAVGGSDYRAYVYSYVNKYGDESAPSPVGYTTAWDGTNEVYVNDIADPSLTMPYSQITKIYLYRTNASASGSAEFQFALEATWFDTDTAYAVGDYVIYSDDLWICSTAHPPSAFSGAHFTQGDWVDDADLLTFFPKTNYDQRPTGLTCLQSHPCGSIIGIYENKLYFSEPYQPHAWPTDYIISFDSTPVALGVFGSTIVVATDSYPQYYVYGNTPGEMYKETMARHYPCVSRSGMVSSEDGVFYPTTNGMVFVTHSDDSTGAKIITEKLIDKHDWEAYHPSQLNGIYYDKKYIGFDPVSRKSFVLDYRSGTFVNLDFKVHANFLDKSGKLFLITNDVEAYYPDDEPTSDVPLCISEFEGSKYNHLQYTWKSKEFILNRPTNLSAVKIVLDSDFYDEVTATLAVIANNESLITAGLSGLVGDNFIGEMSIGGDELTTVGHYTVDHNVYVKVYADGVLKHTETVSSKIKTFRLPSGYLSEKIMFEVIGYIPVKSISLAPSVGEL